MREPEASTTLCHSRGQFVKRIDRGHFLREDTLRQKMAFCLLLPFLMKPECQHCNSRPRSLFAQLNAEQLQALDQQHQPQVRPRGYRIFSEGEEPQGLYCVYSGAVKIFKTAPDGHRMIVRVASSGELLGYTALLSGEPYTAAAETMEEACLCFLPKSLVFSLLQSEPKLSLQWIRMLSREVRQQEDRLVSVAQKRVRERLAETLLILRQSHGISDNKGVLINLRLRRQDLAAIIGTSTESLVRELQELRKQQIIQVHQRMIRIVNVPKLIHAANL